MTPALKIMAYILDAANNSFKVEYKHPKVTMNSFQ